MTRVELHDARYPQDYVTLHGYMSQEGFTNTIQARDGKVYELPPAEYDLTGNYTQEQVIEKARRAAQKTRKQFAVVVAEYSGCTWFGLQVAQPRARVY